MKYIQNCCLQNTGHFVPPHALNPLFCRLILLILRRLEVDERR